MSVLLLWGKTRECALGKILLLWGKMRGMCSGEASVTLGKNVLERNVK
ncbi:MAG TPA: hypothetical protein PLR86_11310 [Planctomycetota bacterium]|nr:hypothetical protein [Planctomycetota bacterium]